MKRDEDKVRDDESEDVLGDPPETELAAEDDEDDPLMAEDEVETTERDWM